SDSTMEIVSQYPHVSKVISEQDHGLYFAMNKGIELSTGEIIGILNADDVYASNDVIEKVIQSFLTSGSDLLYGNLVYVGRKNLSKVIRLWNPGTYTLNSFYNGWSPPHPTFFVKRKIYQQFGGFDTSFKIAADYELMLRFLLKNGIRGYYLNCLIVKMRTGGISSRSLKLRLIANREDRRAWDVNGLKPHLFTLILKPLTKIKQFLFKWQK
ncbi:MAG: hypothetical protein RL713_1364, partial [Bacteroidota bacterium]